MKGKGMEEILVKLETFNNGTQLFRSNNSRENLRFVENSYSSNLILFW